MRIRYPEAVSFQGAAGPTLTLAGQHGERFTISVLEEYLVRVQHWPDGRPRLERTWMVCAPDGVDGMPSGRSRQDLSPFSCPAFRLDPQSDGRLRVQTAALALEIIPGDLQLRWLDPHGRCFAADLAGRAYACDQQSGAVYHYLLRQPGERYYGFGERSGPLNKAGRRMRMLNLDALGYDAETGDPLYKHWPFYITWRPDLQIAYGLFYDNLATTTFDLGCEIDNYDPPYRYYQAEGGDLEYYLIYGPDIPSVVQRFAALTGRPALPPRWTLGYLGSTMQYTEAPDAQAQLHQFVELLDRHDIPCDLFHLSSGYTSGADGKRYVFEWNRSRIPDPAEMVADFHRAGVRLAANIKPALLTSHPRFAELAQAGGFIQTADGSGPQLVRFWGGQAAYLDFTNPQARAWWQRRLSEALLALGIDATWNDNNEFEVWDDDARCHGFGSALPIGLIRPLQTLLMVHASYQAQLAAAPARRPYLITRAGCPGIQRYAQTWSGDNATSWNTLRYNIPMGLGAGLSGIANTGHDVGGFAGPRPDPELFVRWVQNGVCQPRFTIHSWNSDGSANEPWMYPEVLPLVRAAIRWRYRLIPYLYSLLFEAALSGQPLIRPLVYAYPDDEHCVDESFDFLLGPNLLVASVLEPGARQRTVYLPAGQDWCDFAGGDWYRGGTTATIAAPLERIPLLVPEGGILPLGEAGRGGTAADALRQVYVFPHRGEGLGQFDLIEDDGESLDYRQGAYSRVRLRVAALAGGIRLELDWMQRGYPLPYTQIEWVLPPGEMRPVQVDRQTDAWCDEDGRRHIRARLA